MTPSLPPPTPATLKNLSRDQWFFGTSTYYPDESRFIEVHDQHRRLVVSRLRSDLEASAISRVPDMLAFLLELRDDPDSNVWFVTQKKAAELLRVIEECVQ